MLLAASFAVANKDGRCGSGAGAADVEYDGTGTRNADDGGLAGAAGVIGALAAAAAGIRSAFGGKARPVVDPSKMAGTDWATFVRQERERRGYTGTVATQPRSIYKRGRDGNHLDRPYSVMVAGLAEIDAEGERTGKVAMSDMVITNIVGRNVSSESATMALLSGMRVIAKFAFGDHVECPAMKHDDAGWLSHT